ncbi:MAG TPA: hypothetical protein VD969_16475 [Symbiobacteriaceae bacterium]|nr:hypothetical protein [Symbiobacteriaceae bacterium]
MRRSEDVDRTLAQVAAAAYQILAAEQWQGSPFADEAGRLDGLEAGLAGAPFRPSGKLKDDELQRAQKEVGLALGALNRLLHIVVANCRYQAFSRVEGHSIPVLDGLTAVWSVSIPDMPEVVTEQLVAYDRQALPRLAAAVSEQVDGWPGARSAKLLGRLYEADPHDADALIPALIAGLRATNLETIAACHGTLAAIGKPALCGLAQLLDKGERVDQLEVFRCLREIPLHSSAKLIQAHWGLHATTGPDFMAMVCAELGSRELLTPLRAEWRPGEPTVAGAIRLLSQFHGIPLDEDPALAADATRLPADPGDDALLPQPTRPGFRTWPY